MTTLLIDVGNSQLKWVLNHQQETLSHQRLSKTENYLKELAATWQEFETVNTVVISNVKGFKVTQALIDLCQGLWPKVQCVTASAEETCCGVTNSYLQPEKLGVDRWLVLIASWTQSLKPLVVVDCGTAITVDALNRKGQHLGGLIIPGFSLMQRSLSEHTFALSKGDAPFKPTLGNATEAAIVNGSVLAAAGLVEKVIHDLEQTEGESFQLVLTGGDALRLEQALDRSCVVDAELIFKGLQCYLETHR